MTEYEQKLYDVIADWWDEDLQDKFEEWKIRDAEVERLMNSKNGNQEELLNEQGGD